MAYYRVMNQQPLTENDFYTAHHAAIFKAIQGIAKNNGKIDLLTVGQAFVASGGDIMDVMDISNTVGSTANLEYHVQCLKQVTMRRELIKISDITQKSAFDASVDILETVGYAQRSVMEVTDKLTKTEDNLSDILQGIDNDADGVYNPANSPVSTGITDLDKNICGGVENDDFFVIGADSGVGKTALMFNIVSSFLENGKSCAVFSYEMSTKKLLIRLISAKAEVMAQNIKMGTMSEDERQRYKLARLWINEKIEKNLLHIFDCGGMSIEVLRAKCIAASCQHKINGIFIDYMQLIPTGRFFKDQNESSSFVARELMNIKKHLGVPVIAASQLRKNKLGSRPTAADLLGAQALENCASKILLIHRPEKEGIMQFEDGEDSIGKADIYIAKNREGQTACERIRYSGYYFKFENYQQAQWNSAF